ncbi:MAG: sn-glycerol-3-phosphate dehydrogenase subunit C [Chloroflexi bacterium RBG_16_57_11]|nr:MAG: sn-glycerol-3-phosphate dehydrogenase subunit C [Chloroflexi bacterium RBG_16_57_11]
MDLSHQPVEISIDQCIKCNICTTVCPVSAVTDLFPGPKYEAPQAGRFRQANQPTPDRSVDYCSGCRACNLACPTGVKIAEMNARARATMVQQGKISQVYRLRNNLIARAELVGRLAQPIAPLANTVLRFKPARFAMEKMLGIAREAPFPTISSHRFTPWFQRHLREQRENLAMGSHGRQVVYFHGCSTQYYEPRIGRAAVHVLERNGFEVIVPPQNCCGLPLLSNGEFTAARKYHTSNVQKLVEYARQGIPIVGTSTSCTLTLKEEAPELLDMYDEDTTLVAQQTFDLNEFLVSLLDQGLLDLDLQSIPLTLPYHVPCQYRGHRLGRPGVEILDCIPELRVVESEAACCGIAGTYGFKVEKYQIAMQVGEPLFAFIRESGAPVVICDSETCRWHITHATSLPAIHPIELLAAAYDYQPEGALAEVLP